MTNFEILKKAHGVVASLIAQRSPDAFVTARAAYAKLGDCVSTAKNADKFGPVPQSFEAGVREVIDMLASVSSGYVAKGDEKTKELQGPELAALVNAEVEKALGEDLVSSLRRLNKLKWAIEKAASYENASTITFPVTNDPDQQVPTEEEKPGAKEGAGTSAPGSAPTNFAVNPGEVLKALTDKVDRAGSDVADVGWTLDLNSREFLHGERKVDFGRDGTPAK